jgi:hypothetical protein
MNTVVVIIIVFAVVLYLLNFKSEGFHMMYQYDWGAPYKDDTFSLSDRVDNEFTQEFDEFFNDARRVTCVFPEDWRRLQYCGHVYGGIDAKFPHGVPHNNFHPDNISAVYL